MKTPPYHVPFWRKLFGGPSKELASVESGTRGMVHSSRLLRIRASELAAKAVEIASIAKTLRGNPGK